MGWLILAVFIGYILYGTKYFLYYIGFILLAFIVGILGEMSKKKLPIEKTWWKSEETMFSSYEISKIDNMEGHEFEYWCANLLKKLGYNNVYVTSGSGDQGVDVIAEKGGNRWAFQCKRYSSNVGNAAVQQVYAGKMIYDCQIGVVITNQHFTESARSLASKADIQLWDRGKLIELLENVRKFEMLKLKELEEKEPKQKEPRKSLKTQIAERKIRKSWKEKWAPMSKEEVKRYKDLPHVELEEGMNEEEELYFDGDPVDPWVLGGDFVLSLVSREFDDFHHAEHLAKAVEKHFYAETEVKSSEHLTFFVYVKVRARNIRVNFEKDHFVVANWA